MTVLDPNIEQEFIREFSIGGNQIGSCTNAVDRRERIRVAIYQAGLSDKIYRDSGMTYATAYRLCYGRLLEMRRFPREIEAEKIKMLEEPTNDSNAEDDADLIE